MLRIYNYNSFNMYINIRIIIRSYLWFLDDNLNLALKLILDYGK